MGEDDDSSDAFTFGPLNMPVQVADDDNYGDGLGEENPETDSMVIESLMRNKLNDSVIEESMQSGDIDSLINAGILTEESIVRLNQRVIEEDAAKIDVSLLIAKEKNSPIYKALVETAIRMDELTKEALNQYGDMADNRIKVAKNKLKTSSTKVSNLIR